MSSMKPLCKSTELNRCIATNRRWKRKQPLVLHRGYSFSIKPNPNRISKFSGELLRWRAEGAQILHSDWLENMVWRQIAILLSLSAIIIIIIIITWYWRRVRWHLGRTGWGDTDCERCVTSVYQAHINRPRTRWSRQSDAFHWRSAGLAVNDMISQNNCKLEFGFST